MRPGVYIGKSKEGSYDLVSTGDYINPITTAFKLKDSQTTLGVTHTLYLIIYDIEIEYIKVEVSGSMTFIRCYLSWNGNEWSKKIELHENIDTTGGKTEIRQFLFSVVCDDYLDYYSFTTESIFKNYKLKLVYI